jgi:hypothetical protein
VTRGIGMPPYSLRIDGYSLAIYSLLMIAVAAMILFVYLLTRTAYGRKARIDRDAARCAKRPPLGPALFRRAIRYRIRPRLILRR